MEGESEEEKKKIRDVGFLREKRMDKKQAGFFFLFFLFF